MPVQDGLDHFRERAPFKKAVDLLFTGHVPRPVLENLILNTISSYLEWSELGANAPRYSTVAKDHKAICKAALALRAAIGAANPDSIEAYLINGQAVPDWFEILGYRDLDPWGGGTKRIHVTPFMARLEAIANFSNSIATCYKEQERTGPISFLQDNNRKTQRMLADNARSLLLMVGKPAGCGKTGNLCNLITFIWRAAENKGGACSWAPKVINDLGTWLKVYGPLWEEWSELYPTLIAAPDEATVQRAGELVSAMEDLVGKWLSDDSREWRPQPN